MIEIYGFPPDKILCPNCRKAVQLCEDNNLEFKFYPIIDDLVRGRGIPNNNAKVLASRLGKGERDSLEVPQVFVDGIPIGGLSGIRNYVRTTVYKSDR